MCNLVDVGQRLLILDQHLGKLESLVWIHPHHISQQKHPVWSVADLLKGAKGENATLFAALKIILHPKQWKTNTEGVILKIQIHHKYGFIFHTQSIIGIEK